MNILYEPKIDMKTFHWKNLHQNPAPIKLKMKSEKWTPSVSDPPHSVKVKDFTPVKLSLHSVR